MATELIVTDAADLTPSLRRVRFRSEDLSAFADSVFTDRYVKLVFPRPGVTYPHLDVKKLRGTIPAEDLPVTRTYTALQPDVAAGTLTIDFVVHGDEGVAGPWAAAAQPGDTILVNGPGGAYRPDPTADWHLLVGDESALPAISAALADLPDGARAIVFAQVESAAHEVDFPTAADLELTFLHRPRGAAGRLLDAVASMAWPTGRVHAFVHGEAAETMHGLRPHLFKERGLDRAQVSISGYWRQGRTEETFREWKSELAARENS